VFTHFIQIIVVAEEAFDGDANLSPEQNENRHLPIYNICFSYSDKFLKWFAKRLVMAA
jgi:hypothetical protein